MCSRKTHDLTATTLEMGHGAGFRACMPPETSFLVGVELHILYDSDSCRYLKLYTSVTDGIRRFNAPWATQAFFNSLNP